MVIGTSLFNGVIIEVTRRFYAKRTDDDGFIRLKVFNHSVFNYSSISTQILEESLSGEYLDTYT